MEDAAQDQPGTRRERLKRERERRILEAAAAIFARKGFHQATIHEIAGLADVADGTIYNYYANKEELLLAMTRHVIAESAYNVLAEHHLDDDRAFLTAVLSERFAFVERYPDFVRAMFAEVWINGALREQFLGRVITPLLELLEGYLQERIKAGTVRPLETGIVVRAMAGGFLAFVLLSQPGYGGLQAHVPRDQVVNELVDFYLLGLRPRQDGGELAV